MQLSPVLIHAQSISPSLAQSVLPETRRLILTGWGESWYWCSRVRASFSRWYVRPEIKNLLRCNHRAAQSNPVSFIYSCPFFSFFYFHLSPTLWLFPFFPVCSYILSFSILSSLTVFNLTPSNSTGTVCIHNIYILAILPHIDLPHKLCDWTDSSFTEMDLSAELDKSEHTDCSALRTSKRSQSWTIRPSQMEFLANTDTWTLVAG